MRAFLAAFFAAAALVHLGTQWLRKTGGPEGWVMKLSKACLLPPLLGFYALTAPETAPLALLGGLCGWLGDLFLLHSGRQLFFKLGLVSFLLGHLAYIGVFLSRLPALNLPLLFPSLGAALILGILVLRLIGPSPALRIPVILYSAILELMSLTALQLAFFHRNLPSGAIFAGSLCFLYSDSLLAYSTFRAPSGKSHFWVMLSYLAAQTCILGGLSILP
jgi:uncharacterized membrane protein YhhN